MLNVLKSRIGSPELEARLTQLTTALSGLALLPMAVIALERNSANRVEFAIGFGLALVLALHLLMLGMLVSRVNRLETPLRARWPEFCSGFACVGLLIGGLQYLVTLGGSAAQVTLGVLLVALLSVAVLVFGMLTTAVRSPRL
jgi:hypothetical protein